MTKQQAKAPVMDISEVTTAQMTTLFFDRGNLIRLVSSTEEFNVAFKAKDEEFVMEVLLAIK